MNHYRMVMEVGMGTDLQGQDYTKAAIRAVKDALWHNSLTVAPAFGIDRHDMLVDVTVGVAKPEQVDIGAVTDVFPYGKVTGQAVAGGLDIPAEDGSKVTVIANAAVVVHLALEPVDD